MKLVIAAICLVSLSAGCASGAKQSETRPTRCTTLGCIEADAVSLSPPGAELQLAECEDGRKNSYHYEKTEAGWRLVRYSTEQSAECAVAECT